MEDFTKHAARILKSGECELLLFGDILEEYCTKKNV
jgi:hypothetical protein